MKEESKVNYAFALKNYQQNGRGRSMKKFCEEEGYDYEKFMQYSRRGQKEYSVLKDADAHQTLSESSIPSTANIERRRRLDVLLAMLYVFLTRN